MHERIPDAIGDKINHDDQREDQERNGQHLRVIAPLHRCCQLHPHAPGPHIAHHRGDAHVELKDIDDVINERGEELGQHRIADDVELARAHGLHSLDGLGIDIICGLRGELGDDRAREERERPYARSWPKSHSCYEQDRIEQIGNGAQDVHQGAHGPIDERGSYNELRPEDDQGQRHERPEERPQRSHLQGLQERSHELRERRKIRGIHPPQKLKELAPVFEDREEIELDALQSPPIERRQQSEPAPNPQPPQPNPCGRDTVCRVSTPPQCHRCLLQKFRG
jgi:hypothetical protein